MKNSYSEKEKSLIFHNFKSDDAIAISERKEKALKELKINASGGQFEPWGEQRGKDYYLFHA